MRYIRGFLIKKAPILWLRNRTTENRKGKKARNIKEKRQSKNFNTVSRRLVAHLSSQRDNSREYHKRANFPENIEFSGISLYFDNSIRHHKNTQNFHGN